MTPNVKHIRTVHLFLFSAGGWFVAALLAMAAVAPARHFDFPDLSAAHLSMGIFGATGGLLHGRLVRTTGGAISWKQCALLSTVWAAVCIAGVTPLFFIFGTPVKMALLAFYSFAIFGSMGGRITGWMVHSAFHRAGKGLVKYVLAWTLSFGVAALAVNPASAVLKLVFPPGAAMFLSIGIMALIVGSGAGYSLLMVAASIETGPLRPEPARIPPTVVSEKAGDIRLSMLILLAAPFYLNDVSNICISDWRVWLLIDVFATKLFPLVLTIRWLRTGKIHRDRLGLVAQSPASFAVVFLVAALAGILILENGPFIVGWLPGYPRIGSIPAIDSVPWKWMDLTVGILLVGVCEELVFRGYLRAALSRYELRALGTTLVSSLMFGLIHWSDGFHQVLVTGAIGAVYMLLYLLSGSLPAIMLAHFMVNFIHYTKIIPDSLFRFF